MQSVFSYWSFSASSLILLALMCILYLYIINFKFNKQLWCFLAAIILIVICGNSPLNFIGENYLFSAHMLSHVLLLLIAAPLLVASIHSENKFKQFFLFISKKIHQAPLASWLIGVGIMWIWHVPYVFNMMMPMHGMKDNSMLMGILMNINMISLLIGGMIFCLPIINPYKKYRITSLTQVLYLSSACVFCSLLGLLITFASAGTYTSYISNDMGGFLSVIRNQWNISIANDQQMAGLIMWVPCCFIYLTASMVILIKWFGEKETNKNETNSYSVL